MTIMRPFVNNNGTSRKELADQRIDAAVAVLAAMGALQKILPHGRDYIGDPARFDHDRSIHWRRREKLQELYDELHEEALAIQNGGA